MYSGTIKVVLPQRRMLSLKEAAQYCGLPVKRFAAQRAVPPIAMPTGDELYDIRDLDEWLDALKHGATDSDDDILGRLE
ncbi:hypothetical protein [Sinorhizobium sp. BJ1]|uniref:hypothetical protein n=1 Tax=Sinorhizobium sp. BJ1 TaxID=2035455 RepID=UPI000BE7956F|nr:hypothetical protein [Sinorhizobium sp. BJ1]PDT85780.1 hypothetical protein CO676_02350 [Sinorhizobium sp. BJ1]